MNKPHAVFRIKDQELPVGEIPRVVGTLSSLPQDFPTEGTVVPCDIVEVRLDEVADRSKWAESCQRIEGVGIPVISTVRLKSEGGKWEDSDQSRLGLFEEALQHLSCVDIEFSSSITATVSKIAAEFGKSCIVSFHDFQRTPRLEELHSIVEQAQALASIVKISTMITTDEDVDVLRVLLGEKWDVPLCVIGMGALGTHTRVSFATLGSCMTYGYLDKPSAPGQLPASALTQALRTIVPAFNQDFIIRKQVLEYA